MTDPTRASHDSRTRELEVFAESSWLVASTLDLGEVLERLADVAQTRLGVDVVRIWLLDARAGLLTLRAETGTTGQPVESLQTLSVGEGLAGRVFATQEPLVVTDVMQDTRVRNRTWFEAEGIRSAMTVPILVDGNPIGIIACMTRTQHDFSPDEVKLAAAVAAPAATAVRNAGLYAEALQRLDEIQAFQRVTSETLSSPDLETALRTVLRETRHLLHADGAYCSFVDATSRDVETVVTVGALTAEFPRFRIIPGEGMSAYVLAERRAVRTDAYLTDPRFLRVPTLDEWARAEEVQAMIGAPIFDRAGQVIALLWAYNRSAAPFTAGDETMISGLAQQAALAIGSARGMEGERQRARETAAVLEIAQACASTLELRPLLRAVARQVAQALGAERCTFSLLRGEVLAPAMAQFADGHVDTALWERFKALSRDGVEAISSADLSAMRTRRPVVVEDTSMSDLVTPEWVAAFGIRTVLAVPLISGDRVIGTLALDDSRGPRAWTTADQDLATTMAAQVALAVDRAGQYEEAAQRAAEVQTLSAVGETLASTLDLQEVLDAIADSAMKITGAQRAVVFEMDQRAGHLLARAVRGMPVEKGYVVHLGQGAAGSAVAERAPVWSADVTADPPPGYDSLQAQIGVTLAEMATRFGYRAVLAVPVVSREAVLGAVCIYWDEVHRPDEREIRLLSALARQAAIAMDNARLVSDLRSTLADLKAAQEGLVRGATLRAVGELAAGASHHLNNLMAVVLGRTQLLLMKHPPEELVASLKTIERAAVDAAETVRRIQAFGRTETGDAAVALDLDAIVREGIQMTRPRWEHEAQVRGASIEIIYEQVTLPRVPGRAAEIREVVTSLLLNAVDAMPAGGRIVIRAWADKKRAFVSIMDSGSGMSAEVRRRAFEPFFTTKGVKSTGLGLAVAYGTIRRHGGEITMDSTEGIGTTATFSLPLAESAATVAPEAPRAERTANILVIDDEVSVLEIVAEVLRGRGHTVTVAPGGREGLLSFSAGSYDLVMTDLGMPDMNGWDVLRAVKAARPATPVLVLTGWGDTAEAPSGMRPDGVLTKPFDLKRLATAVSDALARPA